MTKDDIQAFSAVASLRSYTKAAALLFVTESSLSKKITRLEKEVGVQLLDRSRHGVSLTAAGRVFLEESRGLLGEMDRFLSDVRAAAKDVRVPLHLAVMGTSLGNRMLPKLSDFRKRHPSVALEWSVLSFHEIYDALDHGRVDGAVTSDLGLSTIPHIRTVPPGDRRKCAGPSPGAPLSGKSGIREPPGGTVPRPLGPGVPAGEGHPPLLLRVLGLPSPVPGTGGYGGNPLPPADRKGSRHPSSLRPAEGRSPAGLRGTAVGGLGQ